MVPELELVGFCAKGAPENLVSEADPHHGQPSGPVFAVATRRRGEPDRPGRVRDNSIDAGCQNILGGGIAWAGSTTHTPRRARARAMLNLRPVVEHGNAALRLQPDMASYRLRMP